MRFLIEDAEPGDGGRGPSTTGRPRGRSGHHGGRGRRGEGFGQGFGAGFGAGFGPGGFGPRGRGRGPRARRAAGERGGPAGLVRRAAARRLVHRSRPDHRRPRRDPGRGHAARRRHRRRGRRERHRGGPARPDRPLARADPRAADRRRRGGRAPLRAQGRLGRADRGHPRGVHVAGRAGDDAPAPARARGPGHPDRLGRRPQPVRGPGLVRRAGGAERRRVAGSAARGAGERPAAARAGPGRRAGRAAAVGSPTRADLRVGGRQPTGARSARPPARRPPVVDRAPFGRRPAGGAIRHRLRADAR